MRQDKPTKYIPIGGDFHIDFRNSTGKFRGKEAPLTPRQTTLLVAIGHESKKRSAIASWMDEILSAQHNLPYTTPFISEVHVGFLVSAIRRKFGNDAIKNSRKHNGYHLGKAK